MIELHCHTKMTKGKGLIAPDELVRYGYVLVGLFIAGQVMVYSLLYSLHFCSSRRKSLHLLASGVSVPFFIL